MTLAVNNTAVRDSGGKAVDFNIFLLLQELFSDQKHENQKLAKLAVLGTIALRDEQYQVQMKEYEKEIGKLNEKIQAFKEAIEAKKSESTPWLESFFGALTDIVVGGIIGFMYGGPVGAVLGMIAGGIAFGMSHNSGNEGGAMFTIISKIFGKSDEAERQKNALEIEGAAKSSDLKRQRASQKQNEISMAVQTEFEPVQNSETALANLMTAILKMFAKMADFQGRS